jgi:Domain of unknown function (DUF6265)
MNLNLSKYQQICMMLLVCFFVSFTNPKPNNSQPLALFKQLQGNWQNTKNKLSFEQWTMQSNNVFKGKDYEVSKKDTIVSENFVLNFKNKKWTYSVSVPNQNNGATIGFELASCTKTTAIFKNLQHDFPQIIGYELLTNNMLHAWISDSSNKKIVHFNFKKI